MQYTLKVRSSSPHRGRCPLTATTTFTTTTTTHNSNSNSNDHSICNHIHR